VALPSVPISTARLQVIHNSADAAASVVDVWLNNTLLLDNFAFRTASPFIDAPAGVDFDVVIQPSNSTDTTNALARFTYNLAGGSKYVLVANGIVVPTGYNPATPFNIYVYDMGREFATGIANTDVLVFHGSTDAPIVDVVETGVGAGTIVDNLAYGNFAGYLELPTNDYVLEVRDETGTVTVASYLAPLASLGLQGQALCLVASGFLNPANNNNGAGFGLFAVLPTGGLFIPLTITGIDEVPSVSAKMNIYPNPVSDRLNIDLEMKTNAAVEYKMYNSAGKLVKTGKPGVKADNSQNISVDVSDLPSGLYIVSVNSGKSGITSKVQIVR